MSRMLVTPAWHSGESWPGFLMRLAGANGIDGGLPALSSALQWHRAKLLMAPPPMLLSLLGYTNDKIPYTEAPSTQPHIRFPHHAGRSTFTSVCPRCLLASDTLFSRATWDLPFGLICSTHGSCLLRNCPDCKRPISVYRKRIDRCDCGCMFSTVVCSMQTSTIVQMKRVLELEESSDPLSMTFAAASARHILALHLVRQLAHTSRRALYPGLQRGTRRLSHAWIPEDDLTLCLEWFQDWPRSFELNYVKFAWTRRKEGLAGFNRTVLHVDEFPSLGEVYDGIVKRCRNATSPRKPSEQRERSHVGIKAAMQMTGMHHNTVVWWIQQGLLGEVTSTRKHAEMRYEIPIQRVLDAASLIKRTSSIRELVPSVGLSTSALHALALAGVFKALQIGPATYTARLEPAEVFADVQKALAASHGAMRGDAKAVTLSRAIVMAHQLSTAAPAKMWADVLKRTLPVFQEDSSEASLAATYVKLDELRRWLARHRA